MKQRIERVRRAMSYERIAAANAAMHDMCYAGHLRAADVYFVDGYAELCGKSYNEIKADFIDDEFDGMVAYYSQVYQNA